MIILVRYIFEQGRLYLWAVRATAQSLAPNGRRASEVHKLFKLYKYLTKTFYLS